MKTQEEIKKEYNISSIEWMTLKDGDNKIRIVSDLYDYGVHKVETASGKYQTIICIGKDKGCKYCAEGSQSKVQFLCWVLDRNNNDRVKIMRIGYQIYKQINDLKISEMFGFEKVPQYDMKITKSGVGEDTNYIVVPDEENPLTDKNKEMIMATISDPQVIINRMKSKILGNNPQEETVETEEHSNDDFAENIPF
jgi:hypothetical protein